MRGVLLALGQGLHGFDQPWQRLGLIVADALNSSWSKFTFTGSSHRCRAISGTANRFCEATRLHHAYFAGPALRHETIALTKPNVTVVRVYETMTMFRGRYDEMKTKKQMRTVLIGATIGLGLMLGAGSPVFASGGSGGGGGTGGTTPASGSASGGGATKGGCVNTLSVTASATEALAGNSFIASYVLGACQSRTRVSITATDLSTAAVVWASIPDLAGTVAVWGLPYRLTTYRIDARAVAGTTNTLVSTASTTVATLNALPCTPYIHETVTTGYYINWAAIWAAHDALDCGAVGTRVHMRITNMTTGVVERDYPYLPMSLMIDYEGSPVSYSTPYHVEAELLNGSGSVIASDTADIVSSPNW